MSKENTAVTHPEIRDTEIHDSLMKWLIYAFTAEFFGHYFGARITDIRYLDKEFQQKFPDLRNKIRADLFLSIEVTIENRRHRIVSIIEHKNKREEVIDQVFFYATCSWQMGNDPVWPIALFADDGKWASSPCNERWISFSDKKGKVLFTCDIIKVNNEKSTALIAEKTLFSCLLALKADDEGISREELVKQVYEAADRMGDRLTNDHQFLIHFFTRQYGKLPEKQLKAITKERGMAMPVATSISEFLENKWKAEAKAEGIAEGIAEGKAEGEILGEIKTLKSLRERNMIPEDFYSKEIATLEKRLAELQASGTARKSGTTLVR
ncbi:MAG: hypothetical protein QNK37_15580 [Acidobacteriota bacterium]|nr:hypothetical protein [Acidobacteriota bacterium]